MSDNQAISWRELLTFISPAGQDQIVEFVRRARYERGENWLIEIKSEFPLFSWLAELVCTRSPEQAFGELAKEFPNYPLWLIRDQLIRLHSVLRTEIERPR